MIKKILVIASMALSTANIYAAHPDTVIAPLGTIVTAPASMGSWSFGIEGLYMIPVNAGFQYASISDQGTRTVTHQNKSVNPDASFGGEFDGTYHFAGNSRDMAVALTHIDMDSSSHYQLQNGRMSDPFGLSNHFTNYARADMDNSVDAVDVVLGQTIQIGEMVTLHPFGGIRYADLENNNLAQYFRLNTNNPSQGDGRINTKLDGLGPRAGFDASVSVGSGISFVTTVGASLLKGDINTTITVTPDGDTPVVTSNSGAHSLIPELDAKLGINYHHAIDASNSFDIQLGYQVVDYFEVLDKDYIDAVTPNTINNSSDLGYHGTYARFQINLA